MDLKRRLEDRRAYRRRLGTCHTGNGRRVARAHLARDSERQLSHDTMTKDVTRVKVYGDIALVTGRSRNTGCFNGQRIAADEWITDVYRRVDGRWLCLLTHFDACACRRVVRGRRGDGRSGSRDRGSPAEGICVRHDHLWDEGTRTPAATTAAGSRAHLPGHERATRRARRVAD